MSPRQRTSLLIIGVLVLLFILAAGLSNLELKPGRVYDFVEESQNSSISPITSNADIWVKVLRGILILVVIFLPIYIIYMLIDPRRRRRLVAEIVGYGIFILAMILLQNYFASLNQTEELYLPTPTVEGELMAENMASGEPVSFDAQPSEIAVSIVGIIIGVILAGAAVLAWWLFVYKREPEPHVLAKVAAEAEDTLESLLTGRDLRETILLCYRRMTEVAVKNRGIPREASITPREFEEILVSKGLPAAAVRDLTHLFEDVRYGDIPADEPERRRATLALRTVIAACRMTEEAAG